ncbi:rab-GTPase-TBC domain-containing protein [Zychaea mexicana]|uniref:rab-GTPase-TBC domain-containing protein n=1 Tax=Zychaea mexicana TaxID=64656 RepID=UPI0022FE7802|nr:rab-GTPase-TBC domain-containing protein [Zychaea mexicana]KAI9498622.1 rab-GTPase-TBC domain-containing protein [Zychaea mexicana]
MATHVNPSRKQSQPESLRQAFQNLSTNNSLKRQKSDFQLASSSAAAASAKSSSSSIRPSPLKRCNNYLTVHSPPPPLALKPSQSSPTATSPGLNKSYKASPLASPRTPTSPLLSPQEQPYSPYYDSGFNASSSSIASSICSSESSPRHGGGGTPTTTMTTSSSISVEDDEEEDDEEDGLSMPSTPPPPASPCPWVKQEEEKRFNNEEVADDDDDDDERSPNTNNSNTEQQQRRDAYGFKQPTQWVRLADQLQFEADYQPIRDRQNAKWKSYLAEHQGEFPPVSSKLKRYVRKGIPHDIRGKAWMHYSGAKDKMEANAGLYDSLVKTAEAMGEHNEYAEIINRDLHRTFPDNEQFACAVTAEDGSVTMVPESNPKLRALRRILLAFSVYAPNIGYCQSLNYLAGFFLLFVDDGEEAAFWMLITTVHDYFPENMYDVTMEGAHIDQTVLMMMVYERLPGVWNKIGNGKCFWECVESEGLPSITLVTSHWFLTLFINILPVETVLRVWDSLYIEGSKVLFRVALTIIKMNEKRIWALDDPIEIFPVLQNMPRRLVDCHRFMELVFSRSGVGADISTSEIDRRRVLFRDRRKQQRAAAAAQAAQAAVAVSNHNTPSNNTTTASSSSPLTTTTTSSSGSSPTSALSFRFFRR